MTTTTPSRLLASLLLALASLLAPAYAASEAEVRLIYDTVRSKFPDFKVYCTISEAERRQAAVQVTMELASSRKLTDPYGAGPLAGAMLRRACGIDGPGIDPAKMRWLVSAKPLSFDPGRGTLGTFTRVQSLANKVYAPEGNGPFPAVVISQTKGVSEHLRVHAKALIESGFAVLVVDTFGPRGYKTGVSEPLPAEFARDAYDALAHLLSLPYIDSKRIFQTGYSYGGMAAALLASPEGAQEFKSAARFRATVANYGSCTIATPYAGGQAQATYMPMLSADSDRPILLLMAELDIETPPATCFPLLDQMKADGKDVHWHIYPGTTHGWDKAENNGFVYRTNSGQTMTYRYDAGITKDATERMIAFFNRYR
ncbi:MAG: dienelactone hydrolase family protein [Pseudomonadota bacterium]